MTLGAQSWTDPLNGNSMRRSLPYIYFGVTVACALLAVLAARGVAAQMAMEQRASSDSVDSITFVTRAAIPLLVGFVFSIAWAGKALFDAIRRRTYGSAAWLGAGLMVWVATVFAIRMWY